MNEQIRQATPVELAVLLMEAVCRATLQEQDAVDQLARMSGTDAALVQSELLFLRAFAVQLAVEVELGPGARRDSILAHYGQHWMQVDREVTGAMSELQEHLEHYSGRVRSGAGSRVLQEQVGCAFAERCGSGAAGRDLALLGGALFRAVYEEVARMLAEVEILPDGDDGESRAGSGL